MTRFGLLGKLWRRGGLLILACVLSGCVVPPPLGYDHAGYERPFSESWTIEKGGKCELQCMRIGNSVKCREYKR